MFDLLAVKIRMEPYDPYWDHLIFNIIFISFFVVGSILFLLVCWVLGEDVNEPKLKRIDLSLGGPNHDHPHLKCGPTYLVKKSGCWYIGKFNMEWYGLNFNCNYGGFQYDTPGYNLSQWQECYLLEESPKD